MSERAQPRAASRSSPRRCSSPPGSPPCSSSATSCSPNVSLTYGLIFLGLCFGAHMIIRFTLPHADPYLFPLAAVLASFGLVMIYRIDDELAREQAQWFVVGLVVFAATIIWLRDYTVLERYRYTIALVGIGLLILPRVPGHRRAGQRRVPRREARADLLPARRAGEDRDRHLPRELPARHAPGARAGRQEGRRPAAAAR